jgi:hypothetical protein
MMTIKTLLGLASGNRNKANKASRGNWTFGWSPSQASALSSKAPVKPAKRSVGSSARPVGMYGVLATHSGNGR